MSWEGRDSSFSAPTLAQARAARARGIRVWGGYLGSRSGLGLAVRWNRMSFWNLQEAGIVPIGFCSGFDDPDWVRRTAAEWGVLACVDVEHGIRDDGAWVRDWVQRAHSGLYGLASVHRRSGEPLGRGATFNIVARYLTNGCTGATWDPAAGLRPPGPCAWQCQGSHAEAGLEVDRAFYDESIADLLLAPAPRTSVTPTGVTMSQIQVYYPLIPGRVDTFMIDPDSKGIFRQFTAGGAGGEDNLPRDLASWWGVGTTPQGGWEPNTLSVLVDDLGRWILNAVNRTGADRGQGYELVLRIDGGADQDWIPIGPPVALPALGAGDGYTDKQAVDAVAAKLSAKA